MQFVIVQTFSNILNNFIIYYIFVQKIVLGVVLAHGARQKPLRTSLYPGSRRP
jgi:hypothetical protein